MESTGNYRQVHGLGTGCSLVVDLDSCKAASRPDAAAGHHSTTLSLEHWIETTAAGKMAASTD